jgi:transposase
MASKVAARQGSERAAEVWGEWERRHAELLREATGPQRVLLEAAVRFLEAIDAQAILLRVVAFFLLHAGMGLTLVQVGAAVGRTERAMRTVRALSARQLLESIWDELGRHRQPKLRAEQAGPIAKYLVEHPKCTQSEVVAFIAQEWKIAVDVQTVRRFFKTYGLGVLRSEHDADSGKEDAERPFCSDAPTSEGPFS